MPLRDEVYGAIDSEREYQDSRWGGEQSGGKHSVTEFLLFMDDYLTEAKHVVSRADSPECDERALHTVRKITAMGVCCMEQNGAPRREIRGGN